MIFRPRIAALLALLWLASCGPTPTATPVAPRPTALPTASVAPSLVNTPVPTERPTPHPTDVPIPTPTPIPELVSPLGRGYVLWSYFDHDPGDGVRDFRGDTNRPSSPFDNTVIPGTLPNHLGIDLLVPEGSSVYAAMDGIVIQVGDGLDNPTNPNDRFIVIEHWPGMRTTYHHLSEFLVAVGDHVSQGDLIALSGSTGDNNTWDGKPVPHLHFDLYIDGRQEDPCLFLPEEVCR